MNFVFSRLYQTLLPASTAVMTLIGISLSAKPASAGEINCSGSYYIYPLRVNAKTSGSQISGPVSVKLFNGSSILREASVVPSSSDIVAKQWLRFSGKSNDGGTGELAAYYDASSGSYKGKAVVHSADGTIEVNVTCAYQEDTRRRKARLGSNFES